jgi:hypothetical protein
MTPEKVLSHPARVLSQEQRESYFRDGYLLLPGILSDEWIRRLRAVSDEFVEKSRSVATLRGCAACRTPTSTIRRSGNT